MQNQKNPGFVLVLVMVIIIGFGLAIYFSTR